MKAAKKKSTLGNHWLSFLWSLRRFASRFDDADDDEEEEEGEGEEDDDTVRDEM